MARMPEKAGAQGGSRPPETMSGSRMTDQTNPVSGPDFGAAPQAQTASDAPTSNALLWAPSEERIASTRLWSFMQEVNAEYGTTLDTYDAVYDWSVARLEDFWEQVWDQFELLGDKGYAPYLTSQTDVKGARFFPTAKVNYAENLLRYRDPASPAIVSWTEAGHQQTLSYQELCDQVSRMQQWLVGLGVGHGDKLAVYLPNIPLAIVTMLATSSLGAVFSSASPDFGVRGVLDRFEQIEPKVLVSVDGYTYAGKSLDIRPKLVEIVEGLPSLEAVALAPFLEADPEVASIGKAQRLDHILARFEPQPLTFLRQDVDDPLYIMFSSGTTGAPKCIIHRQGGVLLKHVAELGLNCDIREGDRVFYFTTCGWMMWNWLVSNLAMKATVVLFDGSPFHPNADILWDMAEAERLSFFGTSAKYIDALRKQEIKPKAGRLLSELRTLASTGSPLIHESFDYVYQNIKGDICLSSVAGGTDLVGCFMGGAPISPVYRGEIQKRSLGMATNVFSDTGEPVIGEKGELVCTKPFPTVPLGFLNDPDGKRFHDAYFDRFAGIWTHGDYVELTEHGGLMVYGRSDATLNPGGVRIGTAELYRQVETFDEIAEALVIGQEWDDDTRVVLFVRLVEGVALDEALRSRIRQRVRAECSPRHVPALILAVADIPRTKSGKITELAVRDVVHGRAVKNKEALANPEALDLFAQIPDLQQAKETPLPGGDAPDAGAVEAAAEVTGQSDAPQEEADDDESALGAPDLSDLGQPIDAVSEIEAAEDDGANQISETDTHDPAWDTQQVASEAPSATDDLPAEQATSEPETSDEAPANPLVSATGEAAAASAAAPAHSFDFLVTPTPPATAGAAAPVPKDSQETMPADEREDMLFEALPMFMELAQARASFWDFVWDSIDPKDMTSRAALRGFPTTPLADLFAAQAASAPFGGLTTTPIKDLKQILASVSGASIAVGRFGDWANAAPALYAAGVAEKQVLLNAYSFDGGTHGAMMQAAALSLGCTPIAVGDIDVARLLKTVIDFEVQVFVGPAEALIDMLARAKDQGITALPLRIAVVDQANSQIPSALKMAYPRITITGTMMDEFFGMIAYQPAGEAPFVCSERLIIEICDPATGDQVNTGEIGELVVTKLDKHTPLFRIATGVLTRELQDESPSQRSNTKIQGWMGAKDEVLFFADGSALHGAQILSLMEALPDAEAGLVQIDDLQGVTLNLVAKAGVDEDKLVRDGNRELHIFTGLEGQTILRPEGSISPYGPLIVDRRGA